MCLYIPKFSKIEENFLKFPKLIYLLMSLIINLCWSVSLPILYLIMLIHECYIHLKEGSLIHVKVVTTEADVPSFFI